MLCQRNLRIVSSQEPTCFMTGKEGVRLVQIQEIYKTHNSQILSQWLYMESFTWTSIVFIEILYVLLILMEENGGDTHNTWLTTS